MKNLTLSIKLERILELGNIEKLNTGYKFTLFNHEDFDFISILIAETDIKNFINVVYSQPGIFDYK